MKKILKDNYIVAAFIIYFVGFLIIYVWWKYFSNGLIPLNEVGDFFGGLIGPSLTFVTIFLLVKNSEEESLYRVLDKEIRVFKFYIDNIEERFEKFTFDENVFCDIKNENVSVTHYGLDAILSFLNGLEYLDDKEKSSFKKINDILYIFLKLTGYVKKCKNQEELNVFLVEKILLVQDIANEVEKILIKKPKDIELLKMQKTINQIKNDVKLSFVS